MIRFQEVSYTYLSQGSEEVQSPSMDHISFHIPKGQCVVLCGKSGCGKTTLLRIINGLACHFYQGRLEGDVSVSGMAPASASLPELARVVGSVFQNPRTQFFHTDTTGELAFQLENQNMPREQMRRRLDQVVTELGLESLMERSIFALSGGEKQQIACGSVYASMPQVVVLDEPSSNLDAYAIADFRKLLMRLKAQGKTIVISEHRLYYLRDLADRVLYMKDGEIRGDYTAAEFQSLPAERREQMGLRPLDLNDLKGIALPHGRTGDSEWKIRQFSFAYKHQPETLHIDEVEFPFCGATAIIGHNGAGKSTLSRCLCGLEKRCGGTVQEQGRIYSRKERLKLCYMVMQDVNHQLFTESVLDEICLSMRTEDRAKAEAVLAEMDLLPYRERHPMGLSGGQKQRVAVASAIASERPLIVFDEPTSGLDLFHMRQVAEVVNRITEQGRTAVVVTHDPEFILRCCKFVIHMEHGKIQESYSLCEPEGRERLLRFFLNEMG